MTLRHPLPTALVPVLLAVLATLPVAEPASALQAIGRDCTFQPGSGLLTRQSFGTTFTIFQRNPRYRCAGGVVIRADSMAYYGSTGTAELIGDVFYADSTREMTAVRATYRRDFGNLVANGVGDTAVVVTDRREGGRLTGMNLVFQEAGGGRAEDEVTVYGRMADGTRPSAVLPVEPPPEAEADAPDPAPFDVTADRIFLRGEDYFEAVGDVDVVRDSLVTASDSLEYDQVRATLDLRGRASLVQGADSIAGRRVIVRLPENEIREIETIGRGSLVSRDLDLESPWFRVTFEEGEVDGLWAAPLRRTAAAEPTDTTGALATDPDRDGADPADPDPASERLVRPEVEPEGDLSPLDSLDAVQPVATSGATRITADSLDVSATVGVLDTVRAVGRAHAVSRGDSIDASMLPEIAARDWIRGDTIVASFRSTAEADSTVYELDRIVSAGNASSLYRLAPDTSSSAADTAVADAEAPDPDRVAGDPARPDTVPADTLAAAAEVGDPAADTTAAGSGEEEPEVILPATAPGVHYVVADRIVLVFENDEVKRMEIFGLAEGVHLEPRRRSNAVAEDGGESAGPGQGGDR